MIFSKTITQVLSGRKTQTMRKKHPGDKLVLLTDGNVQVRDASGRPRWTEGNTYAVQRERRHKAEARLRVIALGELPDPLAAIDMAFVRAEGFDTVEAFEKTWRQLHGTKVHEPCWVITFELVPATRGQKKLARQLAKGAAKYGPFRQGSAR